MTDMISIRGHMVYLGPLNTSSDELEDPIMSTTDFFTCNCLAEETAPCALLALTILRLQLTRSNIMSKGGNRYEDTEYYHLSSQGKPLLLRHYLHQISNTTIQKLSF